jgi:hypothetical protein
MPRNAAGPTTRRLNLGLTKIEIVEYLVSSRQRNRDFIIRQNLRDSLAVLEHRYVEVVGQRNLTPEQRELSVRRSHVEWQNRLFTAGVARADGQPRQFISRVN